MKKKNILTSMSVALMLFGGVSSLQAADSAGISGTVTTLGEVNGVAPQLPANITATADVANSTVTITWDSDANVDWYYIWDKDPLTGWHSIKVSGDTTSYTFNGIQNEHSHKFAVSAYNAYGHKTSNSIVVEGGVAPQLPANITATADAANDTVTITWSGDANVEWYYVWEKNLVTGKWHSVKISGNKTSYTFSGMGRPDKHRFALSAYNAYGHQTSNSIVVEGGVAPQLPANITATADAANDTVTVTWSGDANVEWYYVWEKNLVTGKWHSVKISGNKTSYTFSGMGRPDKHRFALSAYNAYGHKTSSSIVAQ